MEPQQAKRLIQKYLRGECTEAERALVESWHIEDLRQHTDYPAAERTEAVFEALRPQLLAYAGAHGALGTGSVHRQTTRRRLRRWLPYAAAAVLVLASLAGGWWYLSTPVSDPILVSDYTNDVAPGSNRAVLRLDDGREITLSGEHAGIVTGDGIVYRDGSTLGAADLSSVQYTLHTPKGGTYRVALPDGSEVWLNAGSTLTYPSSFDGAGERVVELDGEAYFEVARMIGGSAANTPFLVKTRGQTVEVLGTEFNIQAYGDEPGVTTTLVEGKIQVTNLASRRSEVLNPGQQSILIGSDTDLKSVDVHAFTAWKEGLFVFHDEPLESVLRKVARWYDVDVEYRGVDKSERYGGSFSRYENISGVLKNLEYTGGITFKIEGRRIIVTN